VVVVVVVVPVAAEAEDVVGDGTGATAQDFDINDFDEQVSEPESTLTDYEAVPVVEIATTQPEHHLPRASRARAPRLLADEDEDEECCTSSCLSTTETSSSKYSRRRQHKHPPWLVIPASSCQRTPSQARYHKNARRLLEGKSC
jgi:hypothetical protein